MNSEIEQGLHRLQQYLKAEQYRGYDPYDGLSSPLFRLPVLKSNKKIRFLAQQFIKRCPLNLRPLLGIRKGQNPVTLGLCIQGYTNLLKLYPEKKEEYTQEIEYLLDLLEKCFSKGFSGVCWGYDFDWEARYASIPAFQPTVVATGIITNALFEYWQMSQDKRCEKLILSAAQFVIHDLKRSYDGDLFCFSYSPFDQQIVLNASMKAVRILAQSFAINKQTDYLDLALPALKFVVKQQREDGAFVYSDKRQAIDNYHTGYVLDCLDSFQQCSSNFSFQTAIDKGLDFYLKNFFTPEGIPKFYDTSIYPIDCTAAGQSLLTLKRFLPADRHGSKHELAEKVALYMIRNMQHPKGYFYYRKYRLVTVKTSFMRWSDAWMFAGLGGMLSCNGVK